MTAAFEHAFSQTLIHEGGYSNHPSDRGGATKYGITAATWHAYKAEVRPNDGRSVAEITLDDAAAVYCRGYWAPMGLDAVLDRDVSAEIFDTAVNCGVSRAAKIAQEAFNLVRPELVPELAVDGRLGPVSRHAINNFVKSGHKDALLAALNFFQASHYVGLIRKDPSQRVFVRGWMKRCLGSITRK